MRCRLLVAAGIAEAHLDLTDLLGYRVTVRNLDTFGLQRNEGSYKFENHWTKLSLRLPWP
jgi:hypothetical protein